MLKEGGFNLTKFVTNSSTLQKKTEETEGLRQAPPPGQSCSSGDQDESFTKSTLGTTQQVDVRETKVLGVRWSNSVDHLVFDCSDIASQTIDMEPTHQEAHH